METRLDHSALESFSERAGLGRRVFPPMGRGSGEQLRLKEGCLFGGKRSLQELSKQSDSLRAAQRLCPRAL